MEAIAAPTNGHAPIGEDGKSGRLGTLEKRVEELARQHRDTTASLRAAHDRIEELEAKLTGEGVVKLLENAKRAALNKAFDDPDVRKQLIDQALAQQNQ